MRSEKELSTLYYNIFTNILVNNKQLIVETLDAVIQNNTIKANDLFIKIKELMRSELEKHNVTQDEYLLIQRKQLDKVWQHELQKVVQKYLESKGE